MSAASPIGDFTLFGFTPDPERFIGNTLPSRLGVALRSIGMGQPGAFFFYTTYGETAETEQALALKLGFLRSPGMAALSARQLLEQGVVSPGAIDSGALRGNALVACLGKQEPVFSAYKTLLGVPQLYYARLGGGVACSDRLAALVRLLERPELDEELLPMHFLFRSTPGDLTYYRAIRRLLPGELLCWAGGRLSLKIVQDFRFGASRASAAPGQGETLDALYASLRDVVGDYLSQAERQGESLVSLLSGGVDSSLLQHLIDSQTTRRPSRTYSFAVRAPSFSHEIEYARQASQLFQTEHTFVDIQPEDYPGLLQRTIEALAQPPILETEPGMLSVAEYSRGRGLAGRYFVSGQGADTVFGLNYSKKLKALRIAEKFPGAVWVLRAAGGVLKPFSRLSQMALKAGDILASARDPDSFLAPVNSIVVYADPALLRRCFGDEALAKALRGRRELAARYLDSAHYLERVHVLDLMTDTYELGVQRQQLFLAQEREKIHPFFDDDILRFAFSIPPGRRYIKGMRPKYLLKELLQQKTGAAAARKPKGFSVWEADLLDWMRDGPLAPLVRAIELPGFLSRADFDRLLQNPSYFLWELLIFDLFRQRLKKDWQAN